MSQCCNKCKDICNCLNIISLDNSVIIDKDVCTGQCNINLQINPDSIVIAETPFTGNSTSLVITPGGVKGHNPNIEIVPSTDQGNIFELGSDGKPYVQGVHIANAQCITFTQSVINGVKVFTPVIDWQCVANIICPLCGGGCSCAQPTGFAVTFDGRGLNNPDLYRTRLIWQPVVGATGYTVEYKLSSSATWTTIAANQPLTSNSSLVLDLSGQTQQSYDFRVKAICGTCESEYVVLSNQILVECIAPTNAYWDPINLWLVWQAAPNLPSNSFEVQIRRDDQAGFTTINVPAVETPLGSGIYIADLSGYPFTPDFVYHFYIANTCGSTGQVLSDHGSGCAFDCVVPTQSIPTATNITGTSATINWTNIVGVNAHTIKVVDNTTTTIFLPTTNIGFVNTYNLTGLTPGHQYTVTIGYVCGSLGGCVGRDVIFTTTSLPPNCPQPQNLIIS